MWNKTVEDQYQSDPDFLEIMSQDEFKNKLVQETEDLINEENKKLQLLINEENKKLQRMQMYRLYRVWAQMHKGFWGFLFGSYKFKSFLKRDENNDVELKKILNRDKYFDETGNRAPFFKHEESCMIDHVNCYYKLASIREKLKKMCPRVFKNAWYSWFFGLGKNPLNEVITKENFKDMKGRLEKVIDNVDEGKKDELKKEIVAVDNEHGKAKESVEEANNILNVCYRADDGENLLLYLGMKNTKNEILNPSLICDLDRYFYIKFSGAGAEFRKFAEYESQAIQNFNLRTNKEFFNNLIACFRVIYTEEDLEKAITFLKSDDFNCICENKLFEAMFCENKLFEAMPYKDLDGYIKAMRQKVYEYHHKQFFSEEFMNRAKRLSQVNPKYDELVKNIEKKPSEQDYLDGKMAYKTMMENMGDINSKIKSGINVYSKNLNLLDTQCKNLENEIDKKQQDEKGIENKLVELGKINAEFEQKGTNLQTQINELKNDIGKIEQEGKKNGEDMQVTSNQIETESREIKNLEDKKQDIAQEMRGLKDALNKTLKGCTEQLVIIKKDKEDLQIKLRDIDITIKTSEESIARYEQCKKSEEIKLQELQANKDNNLLLGGFFHNCQEKLIASKIKSIEDCLASGNKKLEEEKNNYEEIERQLLNLFEQEKQWKKDKTAAEERTNEKLEKLKIDLESVSCDLNARNDVLQILQNDLSKYETKRDQIVSQQKKLENEMAMLNNDIAMNEDNILSSKEVIKGLEKMKDQTQQELESLLAEKQRVKNEMDETKAIVDYLNWDNFDTEKEKMSVWNRFKKIIVIKRDVKKIKEDEKSAGKQIEYVM